MENNNAIRERVIAKIALSEYRNENYINESKKYLLNKKIGMVACLLIMLTSGAVFGKDIENYIKKIFSNSNKAINQAVESGYLQEIKEGYVYSNGIGIVVDKIVLDRLNLNVSFKFNLTEKEIENIRFKDFSIELENGRKIYSSEIEYKENIEEIYLAQSMNWFNQPQRISDTVFIDSILFELREETPEIKKLKFNINKLDVTYSNNTKKEINGNWNFDVLITEDMKVNSVEYNMIKNNQYVEECIGKLYPTGLEVEIKLNKSFDSVEYIKKNLDKIDNTGIFYLKYNSQKLAPNYFHTSDRLNTQYQLRYDDISSFSKDINVIELYLEPFDLTINLEKTNKNY